MRNVYLLSRRDATVLGVVAVMVAMVALAEPVPQDSAYHLFGDSRSFAGIPNFHNVTSNILFLLVGSIGFVFVARTGPAVVADMTAAWMIFFLGIFLTAFGSAYYHWAPANGPLLWDRLPMTIGFMSLFAIVIGEYFSAAAARRLLLPLLVIGLASVVYWSYTESRGAGDLRAYFAVQFLPMLLIPMIVVLYRTRSTLSPFIAGTIGFYIVAKVVEHFDAEIFAVGHVLSGHTLKHWIAALAPLSLLLGLRARARQQ